MKQSQFLEVIDRDEAEERWRASIDTDALAPETVALEHALGRVLAEDVRAEVDVPGFDRSNMDGFAVRAAGQKRRSPHRYLENLDGILQIQDYFLEQADRHGVPIVDNISFDRSVLQIIRHVTETLRKRGDFDPPDLV